MLAVFEGRLIRTRGEAYPQRGRRRGLRGLPIECTNDRQSFETLFCAMTVHLSIITTEFQGQLCQGTAGGNA